MLPLLMGLGMGALGAYKGQKQAERQQQVEDDSRKQLAAQIKYSPWTGRSSFSPIQYAQTSAADGLIGGGLQGGLSGAAMGQNFEAASAQNAKQMSPWEQMQAEEQKKKQLMMGQQYNDFSGRV